MNPCLKSIFNESINRVDPTSVGNTTNSVKTTSVGNTSNSVSSTSLEPTTTTSVDLTSVGTTTNSVESTILETTKPDGSYFKRGSENKRFWDSDDDSDEPEDGSFLNREKANNFEGFFANKDDSDEIGLLERSNTEYYNVDAQEDGSYFKRGSENNRFWDSDEIGHLERSNTEYYNVDAQEDDSDVYSDDDSDEIGPLERSPRTWGNSLSRPIPERKYPHTDVEKLLDYRYWKLRAKLQCKGLSPCYANPIDDDYTRLLELYKNYWQENKCDDLASDREVDIAYFEEVLKAIRTKFLSTNRLDISLGLNLDRLKELKNAIRLYKIKLKKSESEDGNLERSNSKIQDKPEEYDLKLERTKKEVQFYGKRNNFPDNNRDKEKDVRYWVLKILLQCRGLAPSYANSIYDDDTNSVNLYKEYWECNRCNDMYSDKDCDIAYYELILENVREKFLNFFELDISPAVNPNYLRYLKNTIRNYKSRMPDEINESDEKPKILFDDSVYEIKEKKDLPTRYEPCSCKEHQGNMYQRVSCTYNKVMKLKKDI